MCRWRGPEGVILKRDVYRRALEDPAISAEREAGGGQS